MTALAAEEIGRAVAGPAEEFATFFESSYLGLGRLAYLLTSDPAVADDLTGDTLLAVWRQWDRIRELDDPLAHVRRIMAGMAAGIVAEQARTRRRWPTGRRDNRSTGPVPIVSPTSSRAVSAWDGGEAMPGPAGGPRRGVSGGPTVLDGLPVGRRMCVVLRYAFDLSEREVAAVLGVSVGTVRSQAAKGLRQLAQSQDTGEKGNP